MTPLVGHRLRSEARQLALGKVPIYAAGIVYNALCVAQGEVAATARLEPEETSPAKFFPKMVAACQSVPGSMLHVGARSGTRRHCPATRGVKHATS